jgi:hypothetical protein
MDLPAKLRTWLEEPSTAELVRRAQEAVADARATIAETDGLSRCAGKSGTAGAGSTRSAPG